MPSRDVPATAQGVRRGKKGEKNRQRKNGNGERRVSMGVACTHGFVARDLKRRRRMGQEKGGKPNFQNNKLEELQNMPRYETAKRSPETTSNKGGQKACRKKQEMETSQARVDDRWPSARFRKVTKGAGDTDEKTLKEHDTFM